MFFSQIPLKRFTGKYILCLVLFTFFCLSATGQNDNCNNASVVSISNGGFGTGIFISSTSDLSSATVQAGETFAPAILVAGQNQKSVWYKFSIPTTRSVRVSLAQPGSAITAGDAGFAVYKTNTCLPIVADISTKLTPIGIFGQTFHPCVEAGDYLVQVSGKAVANGPVFIRVELAPSTAAFDNQVQAYDFGTLAIGNRTVTYAVDCQSIEESAEICPVLGNYQQYNKTSWHVFKTPAYFDYITLFLIQQIVGAQKFGYKVYEGDVRTNSFSTLPVISACDSLQTTNPYGARKNFTCGQLNPNTTYSIQLFFHQNFSDNIRFSLFCNGTAPTRAPEPILSAIPSPSNSLGILPSSPAGVTTNKFDYLGCNSRHSIHPCPPSLQPNGVVSTALRYNLSSFFTFSLASTSNVTFATTPAGCGLQLLVRLYQQNVSENCATLDTLNIISVFLANNTINCLAPGTYTMQVMGRDSLVGNIYGYNSFTANSTTPTCFLSNLGQRFDIGITVKTINALNKFSLNIPGAFDPINPVAGIMQSMVNGVVYPAKPDTFGCANTVLPWDTACLPANSKAIYREFIVPDSGIVAITANGFWNKLYKGDANALADAQNVHNYPLRINGLERWSNCFQNTGECGGQRVCVVPGTYTHATFGGAANIGQANQPSYSFRLLTTIHDSPANAENIGTVAPGGTITSTVDRFSCKDNAVPINGYLPCTISGQQATKAIYRQFYLSAPSTVTISGNVFSCSSTTNVGYMTVFSGKATDGLSGLTPLPAPFRCFQNATGNGTCVTLDAGWYTVVTYGSGPSYANPFQNLNQYGYSSYVEYPTQVTVTAQTACPGPKYNRPYKAAIDITTGNPFLLQWAPRVGHTAAIPKTDTTYTLPQENFNCTVDTPFSSHPVISCNAALNKVAFYVFRTTQESFVQIDAKGYWAAVYKGNARTDSASFDATTLIQPCLTQSGYIQLCNLQPGDYTLAIFASNTQNCNNVVPTIYIDRMGYSRFDHANNAYDFGTVPPDSVYHFGKTGDVNPLDANRSPSNDFFYCTTGSQQSDPIDAACGTDFNSQIYNAGVNNDLYNNTTNATPNPWNIARRNLWYTFVVDKGGYVRIRVFNRTIGKGYQYGFAVYKSNVDGTLPFSTVTSTGQVDSTLAQGLTFITQNSNGGNYCFQRSNEVVFYRDPCSPVAERYYIVVFNQNSYPNEIPAMKPNSQTEVAILLDSMNAIQPKFDHYSQAYAIGTNLGTGTYTGAIDNYSCATKDATDPIYNNYACATKTLWYKFTTNVTGHLKFRLVVNGQTYYSWTDISLFKQIIPNDSTTLGMQFLNGSNTVFFDAPTSTNWGLQCITPGTYYLVLTGCNRINEYGYPQIQIMEEAGDFCDAPVIANLNGPGTSVSPVLIDCHTIGTDYGEFNPSLTCPSGGATSQYKTSWFRINITGNDTLDVTTFLTENTTATSTNIKYRLMNGNCGAMQERSCVQDALTQDTYKCLAPGNYWIQVFSPIGTTGSINLNLSAVRHVDTCAPIPPCLANANFQPQLNCATGDRVSFVNYSTFGSSVSYSWDFGYNGQTSNAVSPQFNYPALANAQTYTVTLTVNNASCSTGGTVVYSAPVTIPGRPNVNLGNDTIMCAAGSVLQLNATTWPGSTYQWQNGTTNPIFNVTTSGTYWANVTYNGCVKRDSVIVKINPITRLLQTKYLCGNDSVLLNSTRGQGESYSWSTGVNVASIYAKTPGVYINTLTWNNCTIRDTFNVVNAIEPFSKRDTTICFPFHSFALTAITPGAVGYQWQNGSGASSFNVTATGTYWVAVNNGTCIKRDTVIVLVSPAPLSSVNNASICAGSTYTLPWGVVVGAAGVYRDTLRYPGGCDSLRRTINITVQSSASQTQNRIICQGTSYTLPWGSIVSTAGVYRDTLHYTTGCDSVWRTVNIVVQSPTSQALSPVICQGASYTLPWGTVVNAPGVYRDTLRYSTGCDSIRRTVDLTIQSPSPQISNPVICEGSSYTLPWGSVVSAAGVYRDTLRYATGCDSIRRIVNLAVQSPSPQIINPVICEGGSYTLPWGTIVNASGAYRDTLHYTTGCDSVRRTVNLTVQDHVDQQINPIICRGASYTLPWGTVVTAGGVYRDTLHYGTGCDSLRRTVNLIVQDALSQNTNAVICAGQTYTLPWGSVVNSSAVYRDTLHYTTGCDSIWRAVNLTVQDPVSQITNPIICAGQTYTLPWGAIVNTGGVYRDTLHYGTGCDSIWRAVNLTVQSHTDQLISPVICRGSSYTLPWGAVVTTTGVYRDTLHYGTGCDSLRRTVNLTVQDPLLQASSPSICAGSTYTLPWGAVVNTSGVYRDTLHYSTGCDSIWRAVNLTVQDHVSQMTTPVICQGQNYTLPWGAVVNTSGVYRDTLHYTTGCDSVRRTVTLTVQIPLPQSSNAIICAGENYTLPWGTVVNATGVYRDTLHYTTGCDSVRRAVNLTVQSPSPQNTNAIICQGGNYTLPWGAVVNTAGTYRDTLHYTTGCDSVRRTVNLQVTAAALSNINAIICSDETYTLPWSVVTNTAGTYKDTVRTVVGCDSLIRTVNLTVNPAPSVTINKSNDVDCMLSIAKLDASGGVRYTWTPAISLDNPTVYNPVASPSTSTWYKVLVTSNKGCTTEDSIQVKVITGPVENGYLVANAFTPNGDGKNDCFGVQTWGAVTDFELSVYNRWGERVFYTRDPRQCWDGRLRGKEQSSAVFIYQIRAKGLCGDIYRNGIVTLIR